MKKTISLDVLDSKSINSAIKELKQHKKDFMAKVKQFAYRLAEFGYYEAKLQIYSLGAVNTSNLLNSIHIKQKNTKDKIVYYVVADSDYACFVEFGTGVVGQALPYPKDYPEGITWEYAVGKTIHEDSEGVKGWFFPLDDGTWRWTYGQESRPFMTQTALEIIDNVERLAKEVFK